VDIENKTEEVVEEKVETEEKETKKNKKAKFDVEKDPKYISLKEENEKLMDQLLRKQAEIY
jgi:molecular chaperone GrpE (heat shock protein)